MFNENETQTQEIENAQASAPQSSAANEIQADLSGFYPVDAPIYKIIGTDERAGIELIIDCPPLDAKTYQQYLQSIHVVTEQKEGGERTDVDFDAALETAFRYRSGRATNLASGETRDLTPEQLNSLSLRYKRGIADKFMTVSAEVLHATGFDALFDGAQNLIVEVEVFRHYKFTVEITPLDRERQKQLEKSLRRAYRVKDGNKITAKPNVNLNSTFAIFNQSFVGAENCLIEGKPYSAEKRAEFIENLQPHIKDEIMQAVARFYEESLGN